ncbi:hypothetical protein CRG98_007947 [Punica granatum]|uniref:Uncharacterized protein n=1 Tax=Punica granatum TaxID=22663 RepID=A0A2I0KT23_PUNGR|nr:hypothetical protein CRG98_007947 [Punica granatum]
MDFLVWIQLKLRKLDDPVSNEEGVKSIRVVNDTLLILIPKVEHPESLHQFRSISLCNVSYKLVMEMIANRLQGLMSELVSPNQVLMLSLWVRVLVGGVEIVRGKVGPPLLFQWRGELRWHNQSSRLSQHLQSMHIMKLPASVNQDIDRMCRNFIWGHSTDTRKVHLVRWDTITRPRAVGGLGLKRIEDYDTASLAKLGRGLLTRADDLWVLRVAQ